jgi:alkanesulfonate monooxygenase SsuD/methylene tetrahydromethanopterin reductase-like flavin-dependent oxidoreductase (luciferase family)
MDPNAEVSRIDAEYQARIADAEEDQRSQLMLERETAKNAVWQSYGQQQQRAGWVSAALAEFPRAPQSAITGDTEEQVKASAKGLHEHYDTLMKAQEAEITARVEQQARQRMYGRGGGAGGGTGGDGDGGVHAAQTRFQQLAQKVQDTMVAGTGQLTQAEHDMYIQGIGDMLVQRQVTGALPDGQEEQGSIRDDRIQYNRTRR